MTAVAALLTAGAALGALYFTGGSLRATNDQLSTAKQTAVTDRFRLAAEQLASDKVNVRVSGIYLLVRLAKDSPTDEDTVFAVLAAFVRTQTTATDRALPPGQAPVDIQAALTVISRRYIDREQPDLDGPDLNRTCMSKVDFSGPVTTDYALTANGVTQRTSGPSLTMANLQSANLAGANLRDVNLTGANLAGANLISTMLLRAELKFVNLTGANLTGAWLAGADLTGAILTGANLTGADLGYINLNQALLNDVNLTGADLRGTDLRFVGLTGVVYDHTTSWPEGFSPPPSAAR
ncbi:pentapeptide repeat-containing protein [Nocardia asiatica]|uniref:pentapeptide repeat-containing protein n=1 Tax=Nocardia asiatica TaxID=209252 RepID=UPI003EE2E3A3